MATYIGKRIVPIHCGKWDMSKAYEMLSIVLEETSGDSYIARRAVPSGTAITDTHYWILHSLYSQQIKDMSDQMAATEQRIKADNDATEAAIKQDNQVTREHVDQNLEQTTETLTETVLQARSAMTNQKNAFDQTAAALNNRMDAVLAAGTGDGQTEIADARVDFQGVTHDSLGDAIRQTDSALLTKMGDLEGRLIMHDSKTNLLCWDDIVDNSYIDENGIEKHFNGLYATPFIPLLAGEQYYYDFLYTGYYAFYNAEKELIIGYGQGQGLSNPFTTPSGTAYGRFTIAREDYRNQAWIHTENKVPPQYGNQLFTEVKVREDNIPEGSIRGYHVALQSINPEQTTFFVHSENSNYIDFSLCQEYAYVTQGGGIQRTTSKPSGANIFIATGKVILEGGKRYYQRGIFRGYYAFFNSENEVIEGHGNDSSLQDSFVTPQGTAYARFTITDESYGSAWINKYDHEPDMYGYILDDQFIRKDDYAEHPCDYPGDEISAFTHGICIGDSLTSGTMNYNDNGTKYISYDKYSFPRCLERLTGISIENKGRGGNSSAEWYEAMKDVDLSGYDFCIMQLGVNDAIRYSGWTQTSIDGFNNIISKLKQENPHIKIFVANIIPATSYSAANHLAVSEGIKGYVTSLNDPDVFFLDIQQYGNTKKSPAYNCGHLSAFGYWRLAQDYKAYISYIMSRDPMSFREIQFIGTEHSYQ